MSQKETGPRTYGLFPMLKERADAAAGPELCPRGRLVQGSLSESHTTDKGPWAPTAATQRAAPLRCKAFLSCGSLKHRRPTAKNETRTQSLSPAARRPREGRRLPTSSAGRVNGCLLIPTLEGRADQPPCSRLAGVCS